MVERTKTVKPFEGYFLQKIVLNGSVFSGKGEGRKFINLPWVKSQIKEKLGFTPYAGTLNLRLSSESVNQKKLLGNAQKLEIYPEKGFCKGMLIKSYIDNLECAIIIPEVANYPKDVLEIIAPWCLRERLTLIDDDEVIVTVSV
jgi:riboflavin kinase